MSSTCPHHLISEEGGGRWVHQEALQRGARNLCHQKDAEQDTGSDLAQEMQGLPQQLGTPAPNGPKIPSADKRILSAIGSSWQVGD